MLVAILLLVVTLAAAQQPTPCMSPTQFEARVFTNDYSKNFTQFAKVSYDGLNKRVREIEELDIGPEREFYDVLYLHMLNREYRVNLKTRSCNVTTLTRPFIPAGVPAGAKFGGQATIGPVNIVNEHITVIMFDGKTSEGYDIFGSVTTPDCVPVTTGFNSPKTGFIHRTFYDLTIGIPDPNVFNIPRECV